MSIFIVTLLSIFNTVNVFEAITFKIDLLLLHGSWQAIPK